MKRTIFDGLPVSEKVHFEATFQSPFFRLGTKPMLVWDLGRVLQGDRATTNMADDKRKPPSLKDLLETVYEVHRKDIKTYTSGHLNSSKLLKPPGERHARWETSDKPPIRYVSLSMVVYCHSRLKQESDPSTVTVICRFIQA